MQVQVAPTKLSGVLLLKPATVFEDFRGHYVELYNEQLYHEAGIPTQFVQDDISSSSRHVLRGLHGDRVTTKLISCLRGRFYLVVANNDPASPEFRRWDSFVLSEENRSQVLIPPNFGIGHLVLSDQAIFHYKQSTYYDRSSQFTLLWNDPAFNFWWPVQNPILSRRDAGLE